MIDDGSTDDTAAVARAAGRTGRRRGRRAARGRARVGQGQRAVEVAARVPRRHHLLARRRPPQLPRRVRRRGCVEPLLADADTLLVKAYYTRSFEGAPTGGGRVTELVARPLLSLLFPKLADIVQPLGGEYAGAARGARGAAVRRRVGRRARVARRRRRALRTRRGRAGRPRRARAPQPPARRARRRRRSRSSRPRLRARRPRSQFDAPVVELLRGAADGNVDAEPVEVRERPPIVTRARRTARAFTDSVAGRAAGFDCGFLDEQRGARVRLAGCHTRSVSASTCTPGASASARARRRSPGRR